MKEFDCKTIYAHTFPEIEFEMGKAARGARMTVNITGEGRGYALKRGDERCFTKKNKQFSPFCKDAGTWVDKQGYAQDGHGIVRDLLAGLNRCGYEFMVRLE